MKLELSRQIIDKSSNINFNEYHFSGSRILPWDRRTERQTDRTTWRLWIPASWYNYENNQQDATVQVNLLILDSSNMFRAMFSPIIGSTWLYLQHLVVFTHGAAGWCHGWVEISFQLIRDTSRQQLVWTLPDAVHTVKCSQWWAKTSPETC